MFKWIVLFCAVSFSEVYSFHFSSNDKSKDPVEIQADDGISCNQETHVCTAKGNVLIAQGKAKLRADEVTAYLVKKDDNHQSLDKIEAKGHVTIETLDKPQKLMADHGVYDITHGEMVFYGSPVRLELESFWVQAQNRLSFSEKTLTATAEGNAEVFKEGQKLEAPILKAYFQRNTEGKLLLKEVKAIDKGIVRTPDEIMSADHMEHDAVQDKARATGHVRVVRRGSILEGEEAQASVNAGQGVVKGGGGRVKVLLIP